MFPAQICKDEKPSMQLIRLHQKTPSITIFGGHRIYAQLVGQRNKQMTSTLFALPENTGASFGKSVAGPRLMYWPRVNSMKKIGMPAENSIVAYGIRKAAAKFIQSQPNVLTHSFETMTCHLNITTHRHMANLKCFRLRCMYVVSPFKLYHCFSFQVYSQRYSFPIQLNFEE